MRWRVSHLLLLETDRDHYWYPLAGLWRKRSHPKENHHVSVYLVGEYLLFIISDISITRINEALREASMPPT